MNRIFPLQLIPQRERGYVYALLSIVLIASLWNWFAAANFSRGSSGAIHNVLVAVVLLGAATGALQMKSLTRAGAFLRSHQMPDALWRAWVRASVVETTLAWAALCAAMSVLLASRASTLPWPEGAALVSSSLSLGAIAVLHRNSLIARRIGWLTNAAGCVAAVALFGFGAARLLDSVATWPLPTLWLLALSWPVLAASLIRGRSRRLNAFQAVHGATRKPMLAPLTSHLRRYSPLDAAHWKLRPDKVDRSGPQVGWLFYVALPLYLYFNDLKPLGWNDAADVRHLITIAALGVIMTMALVVRDLHWRGILMPRGVRPGRIASDIFSATLRAQYAMLAAAAIFSMTIDHFVRGVEFDQALQAVANHTLLLAEIPFAISIALVIRALPRPNRLRVALMLLLSACWLYVRFVVGYAHLPHWPANGPAYAVLMTALNWPMLRLANRMWTAEKLLACARGADTQ